MINFGQYSFNALKLLHKPYCGVWIILGEKTGNSTNNVIVYSRIAPGILKELKKRTPKTKGGHRRRRFHQHRTRDWGYPELRDHLSNVIFLMKESAKWSKFYRTLQRAAPKYGDTIPLPLDEPNEK